MPRRQKRRECNGILHFALFILKFVIPICLSPKCAGEISTIISRRARCAIDCYAKCAGNGMTKAVYCNCPLRNLETEACNVIATDQSLKDRLIDRNIRFESVYKDLHTIAVQVEPYPNAFIYVFEYTTISSSRVAWNFAGASSSPQITFNIADACRDYQFRTVVVLKSSMKSSNQSWPFVVFKPKDIPVKLPEFAVPPEAIRLDQPRESPDGNFLHTSISWNNPPGYDDSDIYSYESPIAYPIRCMTPEEHLSQPRMELIDGGARMHLSLPIEVLEERCRIYMEVRVLPKCVRIENYDIQASVELDCQKFPNLKYCRKEKSPQCTEIVDLWGQENGAVAIVWQPPNTMNSNGAKTLMDNELERQPLYYSLNFGITKTQLNDPLIRKQIVDGREIRVDGNLTKTEIHSIEVGVEYGVQVCAIYSEEMNKSLFHILPVVGFQCKRCRAPGKDPRCVDCSKLDEESINFEQINKQKNFGNNSRNFASGATIAKASNVSALIVQELPSIECYGRECNVENRTTHYISSNSALLNVFLPHQLSTKADTESLRKKEALLANHTIVVDDIKFNDRVDMFSPLNAQSKIVTTKRVIPPQTIAHKQEQSRTFTTEALKSETSTELSSVFAASSFLFESTLNSTTNLASTATTILPTTSSRSTTFRNVTQNSTNALDKEEQIDFTTLQPHQAVRFNADAPTTPKTTTAIITTTTTDSKINAESKPSTNRKLYRTNKIGDNFASVGHATLDDDNDLLKGTNQLLNSNSLWFNGFGANETKKLKTAKKDENLVVGKIEFVLPLSDSAKISNNNNNNNGSGLFEEDREPPLTHIKKGKNRPQQKASKLAIGKTLETPCTLPNGLVCELGCIDRYKCKCLSENKHYETSCVRGMSCPVISDVRATYENSSQTVKLYSKEIAKLLNEPNLYNKMILEFGELVKINSADYLTKSVGRNKTEINLVYDFSTNDGNEHRVISLNKLDQESLLLFDRRPFEILIRDRLNIAEKTYGISVCLLNTSLIPIAFNVDEFDEEDSKRYAAVHSGFHSELDGSSVSSYSHSLLSPLEMRHVIALNDLESVGGFPGTPTQSLNMHRFIVFVGPLFFILGMLVFGVSLLCMSIIRRHKRRKLNRYASSTLKYAGSTIPRASLKYGSASGILSNSGVTRDFLHSTIPPSAASISAPIFTTAAPSNLISNIQSGFNTTAAQRQPEIHHFEAYGQRVDGVAEAGTSTITTTIEGNFADAVAAGDNLNMHQGMGMGLGNGTVGNGAFFIPDHNSNVQNRFYVHRNVHF